MNTRGVVILTLVVLTSCGLFPALASADDTVETGRLLAVLLDSGRVVIGVNQAMINDIEQGNKGFTVEVFEKQMSEKFKARTGVDLANIKNEKVPAQAKVLLPMLMEAGKTVTRNYQPIINKQGMGFKNFIPATWGTQAAALFTAESGAYMKQTAPVKLVRNQKNVPDEFEAALKGGKKTDWSFL